MKEQRSMQPRVIRNRDIPLLSQVLYTMQDVCSLERQIVWQHDRMYGVTARISGMPGGKGAPTGYDAALAAIGELSEEYGKRMQEYVCALKNAEQIINRIRWPGMRTFVVMLYVENLSPETVRRELNMTRYGMERARRAIEQAEDMQHATWDERFVNFSEIS